MIPDSVTDYRVTSREGRVSRNLECCLLEVKRYVTSREGRVSRNVEYRAKWYGETKSRPARDV